MKISVIGTGYVGLVTGTCFANKGNFVVCVDIDKEKIKALKEGNISIYEPGLEKIILDNMHNDNLKFTTDIKFAVKNSDIIFIAVGTPPDNDNSTDLSNVFLAAKNIGKYIEDYKIIVNKSTVPIGTFSKIKEIIKDEIALRNIKADFDVVSNPEFLREGSGINDFINPDRVIIGSSNDSAKRIMKDLYSNIVSKNKIICMSNAAAEMTKYASNAMLAARISFMNDISNLCDILGVNIEDVKLGMGRDKRIGPLFLNCGIGYGGSCFPKDIKSLIQIGNKNNYTMLLLKAVEEINKNQTETFIKKIVKYFDAFNENLTNKTFAVWGLAFKSDTDDIRESPAIIIIKELLKMHVNIFCYDPKAMKKTFDIFGDKIYYGKNKYSILKNADALLILTEWTEFKEANFNIINSNLKNKIIFDGKNIYSLKYMLSKPFDYISMGRHPIYNCR